jgi:hypothetical protein
MWLVILATPAAGRTADGWSAVDVHPFSGREGSMPNAQQGAWLERVLGFKVGAAPGPNLRQRLSDLGPMLQELRDADPASFAALAGMLRTLVDTLSAPDAEAQVGALEAAVAKAVSSARVNSAAASVGLKIDSKKLLIRWRDAQTTVNETLAQLGQVILAREDVKKDPRQAKVLEAVKALPTLVPEFGGALEGLLDKGVSAGSYAGVAAETLTVIANYRQRLAGAAQLHAFQKLAQSDLGGAELISTLDGALGEIEQELKAVPPSPITA